MAANCLQFYFLELPTPDTPGRKLFAILFSGTSDGSSCEHGKSVYALFKSEHQFWERLKHTRTKMLSYNKQVVAENGDSQKHEIVVLGHPGRAVNNTVSYLEGPRSQLF